MAPRPVLSVDAGSSAVRVAAVDCSGEVRHIENASVAPGAEIDAEAVWQTTARLARRVIERAGPVQAVGCAAQLGLVLLGADGRPSRPASTWMDTRAEDGARRFNEQVGREALARRCGRSAHPELIGPKLAWLAEREPEVLANAEVAFSLKDYLVYRLTSRAITDYVHASYTLLFDITSLRWRPDLAAVATVSPALLPPVCWPWEIVGAVSAAAASETGIPAGVPVVAGGPDGTLGAVGVGLTKVGEAANIAGTSDVIFGLTSGPRADPEGRVVANVYALPGLWAIGGPTTTTGGCLAWLTSLMDRPADDIPGLVDDAERVTAGADGIIVLPDLIGSRAPHWDARACGVFFGLQPQHGRRHLVRAVLEATAYVERDVLESIADVGGAVEVVRVGGGGSRSRVWQQIRADVTGLLHVSGEERDATIRGAAILAAAGCGQFSDPAAAVRAMARGGATYTPDPSMRARYDDAYHLYRSLRRHLIDVFALRHGNVRVA